MIVLGLEGSANKLGFSLFDSERLEILSNERVTYNGPIGEGFKPSDVGDYFKSNLHSLLDKSLSIAQMKLSQVDLICFTRGPGIGTCLDLVAVFAKTIAQVLNLPIVGVNHCVAHIEMGRFCTKFDNPTILYVSGANTQVISYNAHKYHIYGEALDIAIGNCLDKIARYLKISNDPSPGYNIEQIAKNGKNFLIGIPVSVKGMDVAFAGIPSKIQQDFIPKIKSGEISKEDLCMSLQETLFSALIEITERAMSDSNSNELIVVGGVGCNLRLQEMLNVMCKERDAQLGCMDERFCIDNGAMIGYTGWLMYKSADDKSLFTLNNAYNVKIDQRFRTDQVNVTWRD